LKKKKNCHPKMLLKDGQQPQNGCIDHEARFEHSSEDPRKKGGGEILGLCSKEFI